jgi:hypothetical protein
MRKTALNLLLALSCAGTAFGTAARIWVTETTQDFSAGVAHGVSGAPSGGLELSRATERIAGLSEATIFCAAEEPSGALDFGTGDEGKIFRQEKGKEAKLLATLPEKEVTALLLGEDGALYAGTSPHGKVYRIENGKASVYFEPGTQYVWALAFDRKNALYVATGVPAKIFRVVGPGKGEPLFDPQDEHVRCLALDRRGRLWAGTAGKGLLIRLEPDGKAVTVYDSQKAEISALALSGNGGLWAAAVSARTAPSAASEPSRGGAAAAPKEKKPEPSPGGGQPEPTATVTVTVSPSLAPPSPPSAARGAESSELVEVAPDDTTSLVWSSGDDLIYGLLDDEKQGGLFLATGPRGRLYFTSHREVGLSESFDEKRVVAVLPDAAVTDSPAGAYRLVPSSKGEFVSAVKDTGRVSRFGAFRFEAEVPSGARLRFSFRSGNSALPDSTWSAWNAPPEPGGAMTVSAPPARYLQWKAVLEASRGGASPSLRRVECAYQNRNSEPVVETLLAVATNPPDTVSASPSSAPEAPDIETIFTGLEEKPGAASPARARKKGLLTLSWKATDPEGDDLIYDVDFRPQASESWVTLRRGWKFPSLTFDSTLLPDGRYEFRVTASDRPSNPEDPRTGVKVSDPVLIDNTPPSIEIGRVSAGGKGPEVHVRVTDASSPLAQVEWSVNAGAWTRAAADDGMTDSPTESYTILLRPENRGAYLLIRATDAAGNAASKSLAVP